MTTPAASPRAARISSTGAASTCVRSTRCDNATPMAQADPLVGDLFRRESGKISAWLARLLGPSRLDLIEDAVQDAFGTALARWPLDGLPDRPAAWLAVA